MIEKMQKIIDQTDYWDMRILDFRISYFGDEAELLIENDEEYYWRIVFTSCSDVSYSTDAGIRKIDDVKSMKKSQLGYFGQDITVKKADNEGFFSIDLDLSIMEIHIVCKNISVDTVSRNVFGLFWEDNQ